MQLRFSQIHVTILNFVLIACLAVVSAMSVRDIIVRSVGGEPDAPSAPSSAPRMNAGIRTRAFYDTIVKRDIFNETPQDTGPAPVVEADLNLKLIGTSLISRSKPYAIIEDPAGEESLYQVGEDIPDAGRLVSVETNRAIIDRGGGRRVALVIPQTDLPEVPPSDLGGTPVGMSGSPGIRPGLIGRMPAAMRNRLRMLRHRMVPGNVGGNDDSDDKDDSDDSDDSDDNGNAKLDLKKLGPGKFEVSRSEVQQTMEDPSQFFSQMRALPHVVDGKTDGFSLSQVAPGSVFDKLGLQNGDLLTSIDGQPVTSPMQALSLMQAMKTASAIDLTLNRGGTPTSVHLDLR